MAKDPIEPNVELTLPARAALMIFPSALLFPHTIQPLRIFEPRYRTMLKSALRSDRMFCLSSLRPGARDSETPDDFYHLAGLGLIRACVGQADGTSQLILQGLARVRCSEFAMEGPFWTARIVPVRDHGHTDAELPVLMDEVRMLALAAAAQAGPVPDEFPNHLERLRDPGMLADTIGNALITAPAKRLELLEEEDVSERLRKLRQFLKNDLAI